MDPISPREELRGVVRTVVASSRLVLDPDCDGRTIGATPPARNGMPS
jgi:hypothetical protein